jgi:hypothetical protein
MTAKVYKTLYAYQRKYAVRQTRPDVYPEYDFLLVAPNLGAEWLFDAARAYWERYRPTIITDLEFVRLIPQERTIVVTVIALRDMASQLGVQLAQINPNAYYDPVVYTLFDDARAALEQRVNTNQPFGVPMQSSLPTPDPNATAIPTPRLVPTNPPAGFVTMAPPTAQPGEQEPTPLVPTPGPITGG